jgi:predicted metal-dependent hydrolase
VPDFPLPPYSYVPGHFPHPSSDLAGHSYGITPERVASIEPRKWRDCRSYLVGVDLFNHGYYWEAHEGWEQVWRACDRKGITATFLKGLIKLAAAGVKYRENRGAARTTHPSRARELFEEVRRKLPDGDSVYLGLSVDDLIRFAEEAEKLMRGLLSEEVRPVEVVFPFVLCPR